MQNHMEFIKILSFIKIRLNIDKQRLSWNSKYFFYSSKTYLWFNFRQIGVDREALEYQVTERKNAEAAEEARSSAYAREMIRNDKLGVLLQERQDKDTRNLHQKMNDFRAQYQVNIKIDMRPLN